MSIQSIGLNSFLGSYDGDSPYYLGDQSYGESTLAPYIGIRGLDPFGDDAPLSAYNDGAEAPSDTYQRSSILHGFTINIAALKNESYPHYLYNKSLINLDAQQLYSPRPKVNYEFGKDYVEASPDSICPPYFTIKAGGCYDAPVPIRGAPIEFRKVYFRGNLVNTNKGYIPSGETFPRAFQAIFACSKPIEQSTFSPDDTCEPYVKDTLYNSRDDNFELSEYATERDWDEIEIFSQPGCKNAFRLFTGKSFYSGDDSELKDTLIETGYMASGCDTFRFEGISGIVATIGSGILTIAYTGNCSGELSLTGIFSNSGQYTGSSDGCEGFTFSGINGVHTSIEEGSNQLIINYTGGSGGGGGGCNSPFTGFSSDNNHYSGAGCTDIYFSGGRLMETKVSGNILEIDYTGCHSPFINFASNTNEYAGDGICKTFTFSGTSGIHTSIDSSAATLIISQEELDFQASGCLQVSQTTDTVTYGIDKNQILNCLGYEELDISFMNCEDECCSVTVLGKDLSCDGTTTTTEPPGTTTTTYPPGTTTTTAPPGSCSGGDCDGYSVGDSVWYDDGGGSSEYTISSLDCSGGTADITPNGGGATINNVSCFDFS